MKCDDDTFVRVDIVLNEANKVSDGKSIYVGNINYYHQPLRYGKWAVTYEVHLDLVLCLDADTDTDIDVNNYVYRNGREKIIHHTQTVRGMLYHRILPSS